MNATTRHRSRRSRWQAGFTTIALAAGLAVGVVAVSPATAHAAGALTNVQSLPADGLGLPLLSDDGRQQFVRYLTGGSWQATVFGPGHSPAGEVVAHTPSGALPNNETEAMASSYNGRFVAVRSKASNLSVSEPSPAWRPYLVDLDADGDGVFGETGDQTTERLPGAVIGPLTNDRVFGMDITPDGRYVTYTVAGSPTAACRQLVRYDRQAFAATVVSVDNTGTPGSGGTCAGTSTGPGVYEAGISANGTVVAFDSKYNSLAAGDTDNANDVFIRDIVAEVTTVIPCPVGTSCWFLDVSDSGDRVLFIAQSATNMPASLRVFDRTGSVVTTIGEVRAHNEYNWYWVRAGAAMSADGHTVVWEPKVGNVMHQWVDGVDSPIAGFTTLAHHLSLSGSATQVLYNDFSPGGSYSTATIANTAPTAVAVSLTASTPSTEPGSLTIPIDDQLLQAVRGLGLDVLTAPGPAKHAPGPAKHAPGPAKHAPGPAKHAPGPAKHAPLLDSLAAVDRLPLNQVPITGGWRAVLASDPAFNGRPIHLITFGEVLRAARAETISFGLEDLDVSRSLLNNISAVGYLLGATPAVSLVVGGQPWCDVLEAETGETCASLGVGPATSIAELELRADTLALLDEHPLLRRPSLAQSWVAIAAAEAPLTTLVLSDAGLKLSDLGDIHLDDTVAGLGDLTLGQLGVDANTPSALVECGLVTCTPATLLSDVAGAIRPGATLADIEVQVTAKTLADLVPALPTELDAADVALGLLEASDYPWEGLDVQRGGIQPYAAPADQVTVGYTAAVTLTGGEGAWDGTATVTLPLGFLYKAGTAGRSDGGFIAEPIITTSATGTTLQFQLGALPAAATTELTFDAFPGYQLGSHTVTADVRVVDNVPHISQTVTVVTAPTDLSANPGDNPIANDTLRISYSTADDADLFTISAGPRDIVTAWVTHGDRDADLVLFGPPATLDGRPNGLAAQASSSTMEPDPTPAGASELPGVGITRPGVPADVPDQPGVEPVGVSAIAESTVQAASAQGAASVQVSSYNGASSSLPYVVRVRVDAAYQAAACNAPAGVGVAAPAPDLTALPVDLETIILVDVERLGDSFGSATDAAEVLARLEALAASPEVKGAVITLDALVDDSALDTPGQWCDPATRNDVARAINTVVATIRGGGTVAGQPVAAHLGLRHVVLVGNDDVIPMARLVDPSRLGNEDEYADSVPAGPVHEALATGHYLSDDPYVDLAPTTWFNRQLYVPDMAIGRLVETKAEILGAVDAYLDPDGNPMTTDVGTVNPQRVYATGYDFMADGARDTALAGRTSFTEVASTTPPPVDTARVNGTWTGAQVVGTGGVGGDLRADDDDLIALFGHYDHDRALSANGYANGTTDGFSPAEVAAALPGGTRLVLTMGCHSGLSVPGSGGNADDFAQAVVGTGAAYVGITAYGYGTEGADALHERLMTQFAELLGNEYTIGESFALAKQRYSGSSGLHGPYDEKALMSATFYGLPFMRISGPVVPVTPVPLKTPADVPGQSYDAVDLTLDLTYTAEAATNGDTAGDTGDRYVVATVAGVPGVDVTGIGQPLVVPGQPQQPQVAIDITAGTPTALAPAHGVLITDLTALADVTGFDGAFVRPTLVDGAAEPEVPSGDVVFPQTFAAVTTFTDPAGALGQADLRQRQQVVLVPGQYRSDGVFDTDGIGIQTLFSGVDMSVLYSTSTDMVAPQIREVTAELVGTTATLTVRTADPDAARVVALVRVEPTGQWLVVDLTGVGTTRSATLSVPPGTTSFSFLAQVADAAGNVAVGTGRGAGVAPVVVPSVSLAGLTVVEGDDTHQATLTATVTPANTDGFTVGVNVYSVTDVDGDDLALGTLADIYVPPGSTSFSVPVTIYGDTQEEPAGEANVVISVVAGDVVLADDSALLTITDDDTTLPVTVSPIPAAFDESVGTAVMYVSANQPVPATVTMYWHLVSDNVGPYPAGLEVDTVGSPVGMATIAAGDTLSSPIEIGIVNDSEDEWDETAVLNIYTIIGPATLSSESALLTILDDDIPTVELDQAVVSGYEEDGPVSVQLRLDTASIVPLQVTLSTIDGSAVGGEDFTTFTDRVVEIPAGNDVWSFDIDLLDDTTYELAEQFEVAIIDVVGGAAGVYTQHSVTVLSDDAPPTVDLQSVTVSEPGTATAVQVTATLDHPSALPIDVTVTDLGTGAATAGSDYLAFGETTFTVPAGALSASFEVTVAADALDEPDEDIQLRITAVSAAGQVGNAIDATITITDDDPAPTASISDISVVEGDGQLEFAVSLDQPSGMEVQISVDAVAGTATTDQPDYELVDNVVVFAPGQTEATALIVIGDDGVDEPDQTFQVLLSAPVNVQLSSNAATVTILDDDDPPAVRFSDTELSVEEGGPSGGIRSQIGVLVDVQSEWPVSFTLQVNPGSATAADFVLEDIPLQFAPGDPMEFVLDFEVVGDDVYEGNETFSLVVVDAVHATPLDVITVTILEDDPPPVVSVGDASLIEPAADTGVEVAVSLSGPASVPIDVTLTDNGTGSATSGADYAAFSPVTVTIPAGETVSSVVLVVRGDTASEATETVVVAVTSVSPVGAGIGATGMVTILDDDVVPLPTVSVHSGGFKEGRANAITTFRVLVTLSAPSTAPVTVHWASQDGTATAPSDYTTASGVVTIPAGSTSAFITMSANGDNLVEWDEYFRVVLSSPSGATILRSVATITIRSDEKPPRCARCHVRNAPRGVR